MGCTSGKEIKKRTTSLEDVSQKKEVQQKTAIPPNENGQIVATKNRPNESTPTPTNNVIQIPGANKSFLAPDGIPFIDEDSEEELEEKVAAVQQQVPEEKVTVPQQSANATLPTSPDQNKNFITPPSSSHEPTTESSPSALRESSPSSTAAVGDTGVTVVVSESTSHYVEESHREGVSSAGGQEEQAAVVGEILELELRQSSANNTSSAFENANSPHTDEASTEQFQDSFSGGAAQPRPEDVIAATKIQAGIRGFLDRKKVSKIRRESQQNRELPTISVHLDNEPQELEEDHHEHGDAQPSTLEEVRHVVEEDHHHVPAAAAAEGEQHHVGDEQEYEHHQSDTEQLLPRIEVHLDEEHHDDELEHHDDELEHHDDELEHQEHHEPQHREPVQHDFELEHHDHELEHHDHELEHHDHELEHHDHELEHYDHELDQHEHHEHGTGEDHHVESEDHHEHEEHHELVRHENETEDEHLQRQSEYDDEKYDTAAVKIQAGFKGYKTRKEIKAMKAHHHSGDNEVISEERHILLDTTPADTVTKTSDDEHDPKLNLAATKIQANYKGYKTRKQMKKDKK